MKSDYILVEDVNNMCFDCAWSTLLDIADAGITKSEALLGIVFKLIEMYPDEAYGADVARLSDAVNALRADEQRMRGVDPYTPPDIADVN